MPGWKDESSYGRGAKTKIPRVMRMGLPHGFQLFVHRLLDITETWFFSIKWNHMLICEDLELEDPNLEKAQREAVKKAAELLHGWSQAMEAAARELVGENLWENGRS